MSAKPSALFQRLAPIFRREALGFALIFGLGYGGCYALVQSKAALHFGHRRGFKPLQGFLFVWQMAGTPLCVKRKAHLDPARTAPCSLGSARGCPKGARGSSEGRPASADWPGGERLAGHIATLLSS